MYVFDFSGFSRVYISRISFFLYRFFFLVFVAVETILSWDSFSCVYDVSPRCVYEIKMINNRITRVERGEQSNSRRELRQRMYFDFSMESDSV